MRVGCSGLVDAFWVLSDVIWSVIVVLPLEASRICLKYSTMSKTGSQCFGIDQHLAGLEPNCAIISSSIV